MFRLILVSLLSALAAMPAAEPNPAAPGFDAAGSDPEAVAIADRVMTALGGRAAWDETRFLTWNFFGRRRHVWDKATGALRLEGAGREDGVPYLVLMNLESGQGRAWRGGQEVTEPAALAELLDLGEGAWINDSYWMFMPYKLEDSGVTLRHAGEGATAEGRPADILELTFAGVGRTPENKYLVYVGKETGLVEQWDYYEKASDPQPAMSTPWRNWQRYGRILLSDDRGERRHTGIAVLEEVPATLFTSPEEVDWAALGVRD